MDTLVVEAISWTPHLETAGEIALRRRASGHEVGFCFIDAPSPDDYRPTSALARLGRMHRLNKVHRLEDVLGQHGVRVLAPPGMQPVADRESAPASLEDLRRYAFHDAMLGAGVAASLVALTRHSQVRPAQHTDTVREYLALVRSVFADTAALIRAHAPKRILTFNGRFAASVAVSEAARLAGVPVQFHERGATPDKFEIFDEPPQRPRFLQREVERYWSHAASAGEDIGASFYQRRRSGDGVGWLSYVTKQKPGSLPPIPGGKRHIVYFAGSDDEAEFIGHENEWSLFPDQRAVVQFLMDWAAQRSDVVLSVRVHPGIADVHADDQRWWADLRGTNTSVIAASSPVDSYALLDAADLVVTSGSTMGVEATFWGKPSVLLAEAAYGGRDATYEPRSMEELTSLLESNSVTAKPRSSALPYGYHSAVFGTTYKHYRPLSLFRGSFEGKELGYEPEWVQSGPLAQVVRYIRRTVPFNQLKPRA